MPGIRSRSCEEPSVEPSSTTITSCIILHTLPITSSIVNLLLYVGIITQIVIGSTRMLFIAFSHVPARQAPSLYDVQGLVGMHPEALTLRPTLRALRRRCRLMIRIVRKEAAMAAEVAIF